MRKQQTANSDMIMVKLFCVISDYYSNYCYTQSSGYDTTTAYLRYSVGMHEVHSLPTVTNTTGKSGASSSSTRPKAARKATGASVSGKPKK